MLKLLFDVAVDPVKIGDIFRLCYANTEEVVVRFMAVAGS